MKIEEIRKMFPALQGMMNGKPLVYLDNSATSQKPREVIDLIDKMNGGMNANVHRSVYKLGDDVTELFEKARDTVAKFINAPERENIIFTYGTTSSINLVASCYCARFLEHGDSILVTGDAHHSNLVPWQLAAERVGASVKILPLKENGEWDMAYLGNLLDKSVKIVAATHISNVLGLVNPVKKLTELAHSLGIPVLVDGAQGVVHSKVDVRDLDCDFYAFSGHKIYAATGTGVLYGKKKWLEEMPPYMSGGEMIDKVTYAHTTFAGIPLKFEAGTPNFTGTASFIPALDFAARVSSGDLKEPVEKETGEIVKYLSTELPKIDGLRLYGLHEKGNTENKVPVFSVSIEGCFPSDIAQILDKLGIAVRTGHMCAEPLMNRFGVTSMVRASFACYNTLQEAKFYLECLNKAVRMLR
ncbi:MAG: SufS family cysteine desulfurase [Bacteroidales bacterium]|jgi:cysteine desulfurase/selenocysteine lyase|nr:SufS family cysteine desulfurase [Bacteroidales bacterium]